MKKKTLLFYSLLIILFTGCLNKGSNTYTTSEDASVSNFYIKKNDSVPNIQNVVFKVDNTATLGIISNADSIDYGTRVDSLYPNITATATYVSSILMEFKHNGRDTSLYYTGSEAIDFTEPVHMVVMASDRTHTKEYTIYVNVHKVEPKLYSWSQVNKEVYAHAGTMQKGVFFNNKIHWFINDGQHTYCYTSTDGTNWAQNEVTDLNGSFDFSSMTVFNQQLCFVHQGKFYSSTDGANWTATETPLTNLLYVMNNQLWGITSDSITASPDLLNWTAQTALPTGFPQQQYAAICYPARTGGEIGYVMGGVASDGVVLNGRWTTEDGKHWINMSTKDKNFEPITGSALLYYNKQLLLFGGMDGSLSPIENPIMESDDNGLNWFPVDTTYNKLILQEGYSPRAFQSVVLDHSKEIIYLLGGRDRTTSYRDVWRGRVNSIGWE